MQVSFNNNIYHPNYNTSAYATKHIVNFQGAKQLLTPLAEESFSAETTRKMLSKMKKYLQLIGENGRVENVKILNETSRYFDSSARILDGFESEADIYLSISKSSEATNISLNRKYKDSSRTGFVIFNADFDKNGQMIYGKFPSEGLRFERFGDNVRRIYRDKKIYLPIQGNDKAWEHNGRELFAGDRRAFYNDDSTHGAIELFLELARLRTSIFK